MSKPQPAKPVIEDVKPKQVAVAAKAEVAKPVAKIEPVKKGKSVKQAPVTPATEVKEIEIKSLLKLE